MEVRKRKILRNEDSQKQMQGTQRPHPLINQTPKGCATRRAKENNPSVLFTARLDLTPAETE
jgi:hypothetical protein